MGEREVNRDGSGGGRSGVVRNLGGVFTTAVTGRGPRKKSRRPRGPGQQARVITLERMETMEWRNYSLRAAPRKFAVAVDATALDLLATTFRLFLQ